MTSLNSHDSGSNIASGSGILSIFGDEQTSTPSSISASFSLSLSSASSSYGGSAGRGESSLLSLSNGPGILNTTLLCANRLSENLLLWSHIESSLLALWMTDKDSCQKVAFFEFLNI
jgi:hypothetical protein